MIERLQHTIEEWIVPKLEELNCFLVEVKVLNGGKKIEVFIDKDAGVSINDCEQLSRYLDLLLDKEAALQSKYTLDVSSPGLENPLKVQRQYQKNIGKEIEVLMMDGNKKQGILKSADENNISIEIYKPIKQTKNKARVKNNPEEITLEEISFQVIKSVKQKISFGKH